MTRLIDADSSIEKLNTFNDRVHGDTHFICGIESAKEIIQNEPTVQVDSSGFQWIPVSERLPEVRQWVLCQCRAGIMDVLRLTADGRWNKNYPHTEYMSGFVVAWMPLPKPYEVEK